MFVKLHQIYQFKIIFLLFLYFLNYGFTSFTSVVYVSVCSIICLWLGMFLARTTADYSGSFSDLDIRHARENYPNFRLMQQITLLILFVIVAALLVRTFYLSLYLLDNTYSTLRGDLFDGVFNYPVWTILAFRFALLGFVLSLIFFNYAWIKVVFFLSIILSDVFVAGRGDLMTAFQLLILAFILKSDFSRSNFIKLVLMLFLFFLWLFLIHYVRSGGGDFYEFVMLILKVYVLGPFVGVDYHWLLKNDFSIFRLAGLPLRALGMDMYKPDFDFGFGSTNAYNGLATIFSSGGYIAVSLFSMILGFLLAKMEALKSVNIIRYQFQYFLLGILILGLVRGYALDWAFFWIIFLFYLLARVVRIL